MLKTDELSAPSAEAHPAAYSAVSGSRYCLSAGQSLRCTPSHVHVRCFGSPRRRSARIAGPANNCNASNDRRRFRDAIRLPEPRLGGR